MKQFKFLLPVVATMLVSACGGGGDGGSSSSSINVAGAQNQAGGLLTGRFVDSAVAGLPYTTASQSGLTGTDGSFNYQAGETVTFSIGDISLPPVAGADILTPLTVFSTDDITDFRVMNLSRLLQTLDTDGDPVNGINLSDQAIASATGLDVNFATSVDSFASQVGNLVANSGSVNTELVNAIEALDHLQETLFQEGLDERPAAPAPVEEQMEQASTGTPNTATHPLVGTSAEFSNLAHDIAGTLTVLDDRTLLVSNFDYDGGGVNVFFYTGLNGNYRDGGPIGPRLNGRTYNNETIMITIPDGLTLDDFNGLSVWCIPFNANFGDAQL